MLWIQLSTFVLFNVLLLAMIATQVPFRGLRFAAGQHAGTGDGEYTVWHLIADIENERTTAAATSAGERGRECINRLQPVYALTTHPPPNASRTQRADLG
ncbi:hypothetical protein F1721_03455 [Saccharopolyspora hirsuta]|uniref:Uncharacterized protein n=1 Tax=Saccharopolyspora hirsuta TaxID=1837 RepID=A0A5M7C491_SACHI|nr:hypothetical protein [Saccharopolyspora hirsuta]KAA5836909.1 hypothetical protein F1721_03455 [Saccharopolyspora hirsuta]